MTKISNQIVYIPDTEISGLDYLVGTDIDKANKQTVSFRIEDLGGHFNISNGVRNFDYNFYNHIAVSPTPNVGCFYSNDNEIDPNNITHFIFSKLTNRRKDVTEFINSISVTNPFDIIISQKQDVNQNSVFFFRITDVEVFSNYYKLNVSEVFFPENKVLYHILSYAVFNLKSEGETIHNNLQGLNDGDYIHLTALEKNKFDNLPNTFIVNHSELNLDDGTNPHGTTKSDVGLSNVPNLDTTNAVNNEHTHSNKLILDATEESFTTILKNLYDSAVSWISTNGTNLINHLTNFSNPHNVTKSQVGLSNVDNTSDLLKPISTATQAELDKLNTPQITITTAVSIDTTTTVSGLSQKGRNVVIANGATAINYTVNAVDGFVASYVKHGSATITFAQGSGRTLIQVDGTAVLNGAVGSTATISSVGTTDYLRISNA